MPPPAGRPYVVGAVLASVLGSVLVGCAPTGPEADGDPTADVSAATGATATVAAGDWLAGQLRRGLIRDQEQDVVDVGATIDVALAFAEVGGRSRAVSVIADAVEEQLTSYTRAAGQVLPGPTAKALVLLQRTDRDVGRLRSGLEELASTDPAFPGRLRSSTLDDLGDVVGQAYGARALLGADSPRAADVAAYLLRQQCEDGYFRASFSSLGSVGQDCDDNGGSPPDVEATAQTLLLLGPVTRRIEGGQEALRRAAVWLADQQDPGGGFARSEADEADTATTGLVARALGAWGDVDAARAAAESVAALQLADGNDAGAVAPDRTAFEATRGGGLGVPPPEAWRRSTTQAVAALALRD